MSRWSLTLIWALFTASLTGCGGALDRWLIDPDAAVQVTQAQLWSSTSRQWLPPESLSRADDAVLAPQTPWQPVLLPHFSKPTDVPVGYEVSAGWDGRSRLERIEDPSATQVVWYRVAVPASQLKRLWMPGQNLQLYVPRHSETGTVAIYAQGRLLWQTSGSRRWTGAFWPLRVDLTGVKEADLSGQPLVLHVRMARTAEGGSLSSLWLGSDRDVWVAWRVRTLLQTGVIEATAWAYVVVGVFALGLWMWLPRRSREPVHLWFALVAALLPLHLMVYLLNDSSILINETLFAWLWVTSALLMMLGLVGFINAMSGQTQTRLQRWGLAWVLGSMGLVGVMTWANALSKQALDVLMALIIACAAIYYIFALTRCAWRSRDAVSYAFVAQNLMVLLIIWIDWPTLKPDGNSPEGLLLLPFFYPLALLFFVVLVLRQYRGAVMAVRQANVVLQRALADREAELERIHAEKAAIEQAQALTHERHRLMQEMHDGVGSSLVSALRMIEHQGQGAVDTAQLLKECIDDLKLSIDSLDYVAGDLIAVLASLRFRLEPRLRAMGMAFEWRVQPLPPMPWMDATQVLHVLRIFQEVITNVMKHGGSTRLRMATGLDQREGRAGVRISLSDNGPRFTPPPLERLEPARKGLGNIVSRTKQLGGVCEWLGAEPESIPPAPDQTPYSNVFSLWLPISSTALESSETSEVTAQKPPNQPAAQ